MSVSTSSRDPVQAVVDILDGYTTWTNTAPAVFRQQDVSQKARENRSDPTIYVWSPVDGTLDQFDAEYSTYDETQVVECSIWVLDTAGEDSSTEVLQYRDDTIDILGDYANDNGQNIAFHHIRPTSTTDSRQEHITRRTDHLIMSVQADIHEFRDN